MKNTLIVTSSNRGFDPLTRAAIHDCQLQGARWISQTGSADVTFARCAALTQACQIARTATEPVTTFLMVDDDIEFKREQAELVVRESRERNRPCSGLYVQPDNTMAASRIQVNGTSTWVVGLGFLAIPAELLFKLEETSPQFKFTAMRNGAPHYTLLREFTRSGAFDGVWKSEDYYLCERLGGVDLLPIDLGHRKVVSLGASQAMLDMLRGK